MAGRQLVKDYEKVILSFGVFLLIFFSCIVGSINECDDSCPSSNRDLNKTGLSFGIVGILVSLTIILFSTYVIGYVDRY